MMRVYTQFTSCQALSACSCTFSSRNAKRLRVKGLGLHARFEGSQSSQEEYRCDASRAWSTPQRTGGLVSSVRSVALADFHQREPERTTEISGPHRRLLWNRDVSTLSAR